MDKELTDKLSSVSLSLFRAGVLGLGSGSISARVEMSKFIIDKKEAIFDNMSSDSFILLNHARDYRWNDASIDAEIHSTIYQNINDAKFIAYAMAPYTTAYSLNHAIIEPKDYLGKTLFDKIKVYDPKGFEDWHQRVDSEILRIMVEQKTTVVVIKGYGIFAHARDIDELATTISIIENSCKILLLVQSRP